MRSLGAYLIDEKYPDRLRIGNSSNELTSLDPESDEYIDEYIRTMTRGDYHHAGSCKMGSSSDVTAVVDDELR